MKVQQTINNISKGKVAPVYVALGTENYLQDKFKDYLLSLIPEEQQEFNIGRYDMESVNLSVALNDAMSLPFFGDYRLVVIERPYFLTGSRQKNSLDHDLDSFLKYLKHPESSTILFIMAPYPKLDERKKITKQLRKTAEFVECTPLKEREVRVFLSTYLQKKGYQLKPAALELLLERTGAELTTIMNELPKLLLATNDTKVISKDDVTGLVARSFEQNVFDLVDLVLGRKVKEALAMYQELLLQKEEPIKINAILEGQFRLMLQAMILREHGYDQGSIAKQLKAHPYRVKLALRKNRQFKRGDLQIAYTGLVHVEEKMKSSSIDPELLFQFFLLNFSQHRSIA
ncbi:DNA polymerase III subunit delta [Ligilactobacillus pobuzihii]|uniref:DNA polymerase III subunit delta n=1 Tax=Ligilactobacillus pobuzihii TaxID=449659 RepID=A0A0R2LPP8_9LACO|nr:DNA polymerase III subunit delta [Ligilactobacillus pobuzihii]KRK10885.1 DNA polymerase III subunit delta [Ligilactobacillus pobuzihii E100301 = KCTC 13174]KRO01101.1 DNA polymerase III subunit delta [Ligilactobacillus pobuzihii]GEN47823.1 DNA polymerase III subunit delta [Ligilactobacillus pobuzihii]